MKQQDAKHLFNVNTATLVVWGMFAAVVCYATGVWMAVAVIERSNAFAGFRSGVYSFAAVLSAIIAGAIGLAAIMLRDTGRKSRLTMTSNAGQR